MLKIKKKKKSAMENNFSKKPPKLEAICFFPEIDLINYVSLLPLFLKAGRGWGWDVGDRRGLLKELMKTCAPSLSFWFLFLRCRFCL
jgi:hypothetical protein